MAFSFPVVDAHHHLWDLSAVHYPWLMARGERRFFGDPTAIQRDYLPRDFWTDIGDLPIMQSVHVQVGAAPGEEVRETAWLQHCHDTAGEHKLPSAIIAFCDLSAPDAMETLAQQRRFAQLRGLRQIVGRAAADPHHHASDSLLDDANWLEHLRQLPQWDLSFDLQLIPQQMARFARVLERAPELRVALCHCGSPWDQSTAGIAQWRDGLRLLARFENVYCKVSGFGMFNPAWTPQSIRPLVENVLEIFGPDRTMFGSNYPVEKLVCPYDRLWSSYDLLTRSLTEAAREQCFARTAQSFYRLRALADSNTGAAG